MSVITFTPYQERMRATINSMLLERDKQKALGWLFQNDTDAKDSYGKSTVVANLFGYLISSHINHKIIHCFFNERRDGSCFLSMVKDKLQKSGPGNGWEYISKWNSEEVHTKSGSKFRCIDPSAQCLRGVDEDPDLIYVDELTKWTSNEFLETVIKPLMLSTKAQIIICSRPNNDETEMIIHDLLKNRIVERLSTDKEIFITALIHEIGLGLNIPLEICDLLVVFITFAPSIQQEK